MKREVFQSTPSQRGRQVKFVVSNFVPSISIHALAKRATNIAVYQRLLQLYFNPRPRKEGDLIENARTNDKLISIHALAKRATDLRRQGSTWVINISIHALAKRATGDIINVYTRNEVFQSTPSQRGRRVSGEV